MKSVELAQLAEINPTGPKPGELRSNELCCFVPMSALGEDGRLSCLERRPYSELAKGYTPFKANDILLAKITPCYENNKIGLATVSGRFAFGSTEFHVIRCQQDKLDASYLLHFLRQDRIRFLGERRMTGSAGQRRVPKAFLEHLKIPVPALSEQRRIANILDKANGIRRKRAQALAMADELLRSAFLARFGDPLTNRRGLPAAPIKELGRVITGNTPPRANPDNYGNAIEWIKSDNINTPEHILTAADEHLSETGKSIGRTAPPGSTLVTCIAGSPSVIGNAALADREVAFNQQINAVVPNSNTDPHFLYCQFLVGKKLIQAHSTNSMKGMVSKGKFQEIEFLRPSYDDQRAFGQLIQHTLLLRDRIRDDWLSSKRLLGSLTTRAFRGEL